VVLVIIQNTFDAQQKIIL